MSRNTLRILATILTVLIVVVLIHAFDRLPGETRTQIAAERGARATSQQQLRAAQDEGTKEVSAQPDLFRTVPASREWPSAFGQASAGLAAAAHELDELSQLEKNGHRSDRERAQALLARERRERTGAETQAASIRSDAGRWIDLKQRLPEVAQGMERDYRAIRAFDLAPLTTKVQKAELDWPEKQADLGARLAVLTPLAAAAETRWQAGEQARRQASETPAAVDYGAVSDSAAWLKTTAAAMPRQAEELAGLTTQLYRSSDKVLVDMEERGFGNAKAYNQKIRTVRTAVAEAGATAGATTSDDQWIDVSRTQFEAMRNHLGMVIEHKPAGKYDSEAERVAQPAGFAYMAPPGQSNRYGYWERRDGGNFWVFYGQYALLRDLLFNHQYRPIDRGDWEGYRESRRSGQTYYGRDETGGQNQPKYGTSGSATQNRYSGSTYAQGGGFRDSQYATRSGSYRGSQYATPGARTSDPDRGGKTFGRSTRRDDAPHAAPPSPAPRQYRPAPRPAPSRPSIGGGRRFSGRKH